jgi:hypothetical protein
MRRFCDAAGPSEGEYAGRKRRGGRADKAFAAGRLSGSEEARFALVLKEAEQTYAAFARMKPFWE